MDNKETVKVVEKEFTLHLIENDEGMETHCGISYTDEDVIEHPINDAGVWCMDCMGVEFEQSDSDHPGYETDAPLDKEITYGGE